MSLHRDCEDCGWRDELEDKNSSLIKQLEEMGEENTDLRDENEKLKEEIGELKAGIREACRQVIEIISYINY